MVASLPSKYTCPLGGVYLLQQTAHRTIYQIAQKIIDKCRLRNADTFNDDLIIIYILKKKKQPSHK